MTYGFPPVIAYQPIADWYADDLLASFDATTATGLS